MSFRNRCQIAGAGGVIDLSVPLVKGRDQRTLLKDVKIADRGDWQGQHWKTLSSCYSRSPWFEFYRDGLEALYRKRVNFLLDWNLGCLEWVLRHLALPVSFSLTDAYRDGYDPGEWIDWRGRWLPRNRETLSDPASVTLPDPASAVLTGPIRYRQVFEERTGFLPNLSILDLLFCEGPRAKLFLV